MAGDSTFDVRTVFGLVGGMDAFDRLVANFYEGVEADPILRPMYADEDLTASRRRLSMFLAQFFGGPSTYSEERGHPRLRMRHAGFKIDLAARDAWLCPAQGGRQAPGCDPGPPKPIRRNIPSIPHPPG